MRVLLVDDDEDVQQILSRYLQQDGHQVVSARSGAGIDVAVLDLTLPDRFTTGDQSLRWATVAALRVEPRLYRIAGYSHLSIPAQALEVYASRLDEATARAS